MKVKCKLVLLYFLLIQFLGCSSYQVQKIYILDKNNLPKISEDIILVLNRK